MEWIWRSVWWTLSRVSALRPWTVLEQRWFSCFVSEKMRSLSALVIRIVVVLSSLARVGVEGVVTRKEYDGSKSINLSFINWSLKINNLANFCPFQCLGVAVLSLHFSSSAWIRGRVVVVFCLVSYLRRHSRAGDDWRWLDERTCFEVLWKDGLLTKSTIQEGVNHRVHHFHPSSNL